MTGRAGSNQVPGESYTFISRSGERDTGILPKVIGESNSFARWHKDPNCERKGFWESKKFNSQYTRRILDGLGKHGLLGAMRRRLVRAKNPDIGEGRLSIIATPEELVNIWLSQKELCAACGGSINLSIAVLDHDHTTGKARGFIHEHCNFAEGHIHKMTDDEFNNFVIWELKKRAQ